MLKVVFDTRVKYSMLIEENTLRIIKDKSISHLYKKTLKRVLM